MSSEEPISYKDRILGGLWGSLVGDALGVPVEFTDREVLRANPVVSMREFGTHHQPRGTWSDDGALLSCATDSLLNHEFNLEDMGARFVRWLDEGLWTANGDAFDVGGTTCTALRRISSGVRAEEAGGRHEDSNGNGSLMRILPVVLRFAGEPIESFSSRIGKVSAITHAHERSQMACVLYGLVIQHLLRGWQKLPALDSARVEFTWYEKASQFRHFARILEGDLAKTPENLVLSTGYVLDTLHASLWCLLTTDSFKDCVLKAVNLGGDTDTTGCVAGGLAGVAYGIEAIPKEWRTQLARKGDLDCLFQEFADEFGREDKC